MRAGLRIALHGCRAGTALLPPLSILLVAATALQAQVTDLDAACLEAGGSALPCAVASDIADIAGVRALVLAAGASPVPGSASTVGQRLPGSPRWALTARMTGGGVELPGSAGTGTLSGTAVSWNADLAVGIVEGATVGATVGGLGSVDLLASFGIVNLPADARFRRRIGCCVA